MPSTSPATTSTASGTILSARKPLYGQIVLRSALFRKGRRVSGPAWLCGTGRAWCRIDKRPEALWAADERDRTWSLHRTRMVAGTQGSHSQGRVEEDA